MEIAFIVGRLALAAVFAVASLTKLRDLPGARAALTEFGVPKSLSGPLGVGLPVAELAVAGLLLPAATALWGSLFALAFLSIFTAAIVTSLVRGRRPSCRCFGQLSAGPVGLSTLVRNGALCALAGALVWQGWTGEPPGLLPWMAGLATSDGIVVAGGTLLIGALAGGGWLLVQVLQQQGRLLLRIEELEQRLGALDGREAQHSHVPPESEGLPVGAQAPDFRLPSLSGETRTLAGLLPADRPLLLIFTDPSCGPCTALLPEIGGWQRTLSEQMAIAVVGRGSVEANRARATEHDVAPVLLQQDDEVADAYHVFGTPSAVLIRPDGTIGSPLAGGPEAIRSLIAHTARSPHGPTWSPFLLLPMAEQHQTNGHGHDHPHGLAEPAALALGAPAPDFELPDLDGAPVSQTSLLGRPTLLLFWNPGCAYCHQLLPSVLAWEATLSEDSVRVLVISEGDMDENRALGFRAPTLLDHTLSVGMRFGVTGTPSALLLDEHGAVASALAVGGPEVMRLATATLTLATRA